MSILVVTLTTIHFPFLAYGNFLQCSVVCCASCISPISLFRLIVLTFLLQCNCCTAKHSSHTTCRIENNRAIESGKKSATSVPKRFVSDPVAGGAQLCCRVLSYKVAFFPASKGHFYNELKD